ncbi:MAG: hypothetical protein P8188_17110, partial [Gemmatimonadota bacterium]
SPLMGRIADEYANERLPAAETVAFLDATADALAGDTDPDRAAAREAARTVVDAYADRRVLPSPETANALRAVISSGAEPDVTGRAAALLGPADNYGGRISFRYVAPLCGVLVLIFGALYAADRRAGGYRVTRIRAEG